MRVSLLDLVRADCVLGSGFMIDDYGIAASRLNGVGACCIDWVTGQVRRLLNPRITFITTPIHGICYWHVPTLRMPPSEHLMSSLAHGWTF